MNKRITLARAVCIQGPFVMRLPNLGTLSLNARATSADAADVVGGDGDEQVVVELIEDDGNDTEPAEDSGSDTEVVEDDNADPSDGRRDAEPAEPGATVVDGVEVEDDGWFQLNEDQKRALVRRENREAADGARPWYDQGDVSDKGDGSMFESREEEEAFYKFEDEQQAAKEQERDAEKPKKKKKKKSRLGGMSAYARRVPAPADPAPEQPEQEVQTVVDEVIKQVAKKEAQRLRRNELAAKRRASKQAEKKAVEAAGPLTESSPPAAESEKNKGKRKERQVPKDTTNPTPDGNPSEQDVVDI